eukprot:scaffold433_cov257-Pinguiococcus_pyrenoidosus.AAC.2
MHRIIVSVTSIDPDAQPCGCAADVFFSFRCARFLRALFGSFPHPLSRAGAALSEELPASTCALKHAAHPLQAWEPAEELGLSCGLCCAGTQSGDPTEMERVRARGAGAAARGHQAGAPTGASVPGGGGRAALAAVFERPRVSS